MTKIGLLFLTIIFTPICSYAFNYDFWQSGISREKASYLAKRQGIYFILDKNSHDLENNVLVNSVHYKSTLFNEPAKITLTFTHNSNLLYHIGISWENLSKGKSESLFFDISEILSKKYGQFSKTSGKIIMIRDGKRCNGSSTGYSTKYNGDDITLSHSTCFNSLNLNYTNDSLKQVNKVEARKDKIFTSNDTNKL